MSQLFENDLKHLLFTVNMSAGGEKSKSASQTDGKAAHNKMSDPGMMAHKVLTHTRIEQMIKRLQISHTVFFPQCEAGGLTLTVYLQAHVFYHDQLVPTAQ